MINLIKKAFTLIELLVVIAIIGILSGLIVVSMSGVTDKANIAKAQVFSNSLRNSLMSNLIAEWKFDGATIDGGAATNNDALDSWSSGNNGTVTTGITVKTGSNCINGSCFLFDGATTTYIDVGTSSSLKPSKQVTMSFWAKPIAYQTASTSQIGFSAQAGYTFWQYANAGVASCFVIETNPISATRRSMDLNLSLLPLNSWTFVTIVFDGTNGLLKIYKNGSQFASPKTILAGDIGYSGNFYIGRGFNGLLDEVRVFDTVASISQIKEQYYLGLNYLLINGSITKEEYLSRLNDYAVE